MKKNITIYGLEAEKEILDTMIDNIKLDWYITKEEFSEAHPNCDAVEYEVSLELKKK